MAMFKIYRVASSRTNYTEAPLIVGFVALATVLHNAHNNFAHFKRVGQPKTDKQTVRQTYWHTLKTQTETHKHTHISTHIWVL